MRRRIVDPVLRLLAQGATPEALALSLALGAAIGLFPVLGSTTALCALVALVLRLNPVAIQVASYAVYPLQIGLVFVFVRAGEWLLGAPHLPLSITEMEAAFRADAWAFVLRFGRSGLHGILAWALCAPLVAGALYVVLVRVLRTVAARRHGVAVAA